MSLQRPVWQHLALGIALATSVASSWATSSLSSSHFGPGTATALSQDGRYIAGYGPGNATLWKDGELLPGGTYGTVNGVNGSGQVVSYGWDEIYLFQNQTATVVPTYQDDFGSESVAINDAGQILGNSHNGQNFVGVRIESSSGAITELANIEGFGNTWAGGMNAAGDVVGSSWSTNGQYGTATLWSNGQATSLAGSVGTAFSRAVGISNAGHIIGVGGSYEAPNSFNWMLYEGQLHDLGSFIPVAVNASGQIIGRRSAIGSVDTLWTAETGAVYIENLLAPGDALRYGSGSDLSFSAATAINDAGQILAQGWINGEGYQVVLLSPVPETGTFALFAVGLAGLGVMHRVRRRRA